jgi:ketosteroid isomerase-like protein
MTSTSTTPADPHAYADRWVADWNRKDVEAVLALFSDDVVFTSAKAETIVGSSRMEGKAALRQYWTLALARIQSLHFTLDSVISEGDRAGIVYTSEINGKRMRAIELLTFGRDGLIREGEAFYGVSV